MLSPVAVTPSPPSDATGCIVVVDIIVCNISNAGTGAAKNFHRQKLHFLENNIVA